MPWSQLHSAKVAWADEKAWQPFTSAMPRLAAQLAFSPEAFALREEPTEKHVFPRSVADSLRRRPEFAIRHILQWGTLDKLDHPLLIDLIAATRSLNTDIDDFDLSTVNPFAINPKDYDALLPWLAQSLVRWHEGRPPRIFYYDARSPREVLTQAAKIYGFTASALRAISISDQYTPEARAGAAAIHWILRALDADTDPSSSVFEFQSESELFANLKSQANEEWFTEAYVMTVLKHCSSAEYRALYAISHLLEEGSDGRKYYQVLLTLLQSWRERSTAPIHSAQALQQWLSYSFEADV
jgi:hypothetical protein